MAEDVQPSRNTPHVGEPLTDRLKGGLIITVIALGYLGSKPPEGAYVFWARVFTAYYFLHFLVVMPIVGVTENPLPLPRSIAESVLGKSGQPVGVGAPAAPERR